MSSSTVATQANSTQGLYALTLICGTIIILAGAGIYQISRSPPEAVGKSLVIGATGAAAADVIGSAAAAPAATPEPPAPTAGRRRRHKTPKKRKSRRRRHH